MKLSSPSKAFDGELRKVTIDCLVVCICIVFHRKVIAAFFMGSTRRHMRRYDIFYCRAIYATSVCSKIEMIKTTNQRRLGTLQSTHRQLTAEHCFWLSGKRKIVSWSAQQPLQRRYTLTICAPFLLHSPTSYALSIEKQSSSQQQ